MIKILLIYIFSICSVCESEQPLSICASDKLPYKNKDNICVGFNDVCVKREDPECENFYNLCAQCLPSNYSYLMFDDVKNMKSQIRTLMDEVKEYKQKSREITSKLETHANKTDFFVKEISHHIKIILFVLILIVIIVILLLFLLIVENRFKLITKCFKYRAISDKYKILKSRNFYDWKTKHDHMTQELKIIANLIEKFPGDQIDEKLNKVLEHMKVQSEQKPIVKFKVKDNEEVKLGINDDDCVVHIKKKICFILANINDNDYKIMRLKYNGNILDDNRYLLPYITDINTPVHCEIDQYIDADEILVLRVESNVNVPPLIQVQRNKTIEYLKMILSIFFENSEFLIIKDTEIMTKDKSFETFKDNECVKAMKKRQGSLSIRSIFDENESLVVEYSNVDYISEICLRAANKFNAGQHNFVLFLKNEFIDDDKFAFDYNIDDKSVIKYYCLRKITDIELDSKPLDEGYMSQLFAGKKTSTNEKILVTRFEYSIKNMKESKTFLSQLVYYMLRKHSPTFIKFHGIFNDDKYLLVIMDYMAQGTLTNFLSKEPEVTEDKIVKWSSQLLEGVTYKKHNNAFCELKPYGILVDENDNFKMRHFYIPNYMNKIRGSKKANWSYIAPEMDTKEFHDERSLVWSFGVVLLYITFLKPRRDKLEIEIQRYKTENKLFKYPEWISEQLKDFINCCLVTDPDRRSTIDQLLKHEFLRNKQ